MAYTTLNKIVTVFINNPVYAYSLLQVVNTHLSKALFYWQSFTVFSQLGRLLDLDLGLNVFFF